MNRHSRVAAWLLKSLGYISSFFITFSLCSIPRFYPTVCLPYLIWVVASQQKKTWNFYFYKKFSTQTWLKSEISIRVIPLLVLYNSWFGRIFKKSKKKIYISTTILLGMGQTFKFGRSEYGICRYAGWEILFFISFSEMLPTLSKVFLC